MGVESETRRVIAEKQGGSMVGAEEGEVELGYYIDPEWRGNGIMREAVERLIGWGLKEMGVKGVVVKVLEENRASRRVVEGMGNRWERVEFWDEWISWPEEKGGGGRKKLFVWRWIGEGEEE